MVSANGEVALLLDIDQFFLYARDLEENFYQKTETGITYAYVS